MTGKSWAEAFALLARAVGREIGRGARAVAEGYERTGDVARRSARELSNADRGFRHEFDGGEPPSSPPRLEFGPVPPDRYYNGARLWQVDQVFPRAFSERATSEGYIRAASHSSAGEVVYLTDDNGIAGVYGTITSWTDVRDGAMRFHPAGMVLGIDARRIRVNPMAAEGHSAANFIEGVSDRVYTTPGRVDTSEIVSVEFQTYPDIIADPEANLVADGFPGFEGLRQESLRDPAIVADRLSHIADAVRRNYPTIDVSVGANHLSSDEAVRTFLAT
ncbi:hypothetical protein [Nocardia sp. N2S4-5]|uniref:hypothetical protein n=1 Tax=Nocardia sp. N2S4-5 TaxID=3351565 RepID=UPI0037D89EE7